LTAMFATATLAAPTAAQVTALQGADALTQALNAIYDARSSVQIATNLYVGLLGRSPSGGEAQGWISALSNGMKLEDAIVGFVTSPEYVAKVTQGSDFPTGAWLKSLYLNLLGRQASAAEINL